MHFDQMAKTVKSMFSNVAYRPTVYKTGAQSRQARRAKRLFKRVRTRHNSFKPPSFLVIQQCRFVTFCPTSLSRELFIKCQATNKKISCSLKNPENCNSSLLVLFLLFAIESLTRKEIIERSASQAKLCWVLRFLEFLKIV